MLCYRRVLNTEENALGEGMVLYKGPPSLFKVHRFQATILTLTGLSPPIIPGTSFEIYLHGDEVSYENRRNGEYDIYNYCQRLITQAIYIHALQVECHVRQIISMMSLGKGKRDTMKRPKCVPGGRSATVVIETTRPVVVEAFTECRSLGRFALRGKGKTCAVGICDKILSI